ncbi:MAG TPA: phosphatase PAP2 family protein [Saprospiraceae bacterium]|nr:phosphatase PAP2 family protein [Saprospiraceae bacterium]
MKNNLIAVFVILFGLPGFAQQPYQLTWPRELAIAGGSGAGIGVSLMLRPNTKAFTPDQVAALDIADVPWFDLYATRHYSAAARKASDIMLFTSLAIPALLFVDDDIRHDAPEVGVIIGEVFLLNTALTQLTKELTHRPRPFNYNPDVPLDPKLERDARLSFFSGHTSTTAAMCFATAKIWTDYHPDSGWKPVVWISATAIPLAVGFLRMEGGKHFLSDVLVGFVVGSATGWLVPQLHRQRGN